MWQKRLSQLIVYFSALVWFGNGLLCKVLQLVPRHEQIVARILGNTYAHPLTTLIGVSEIIMAIWIVSRFQSRINVILQMVVVATMNIIEFLLAPDLLLWGKLNAVFAVCLIALIFYNEFILRKKLSQYV